MEVVVGNLGLWRIVELRGKFTVKNIPSVRRYFEEAEAAPLPGVVIDMSGVTQLDSSAITLLINFQNRITRKNAMVVVIGLSADIAEIFSIVGIEKVFTLCSSKEAFVEKYSKA